MYHRGLKQSEVPATETLLAAWLKAHKRTAYSIAQMCQCDPTSMTRIVLGKQLPGLILAFRIEQATEGGVPVASWLGTELGRIRWNMPGRNWDRLQQQRQDAHNTWRRKKRATERGEVE